MKGNLQKNFKQSIIIFAVSLILFIICIALYVFFRIQAGKQVIEYREVECTVISTDQKREKTSALSRGRSTRYYYTLECEGQTYEIKRAKKFQALTYDGAKITLLLSDGEFYESYAEIQGDSFYGKAYSILAGPLILLFFFTVVSAALACDYKKKLRSEL